MAANKVVVVPLWTKTKIKNVITVAKSGGQFSNPVAAMASITNAGSNNPYLIVIGPGHYTLNQQLVMKDHVTIVGSGREATFLHGSISGADFASGALVVGGVYCSMSNLAIENKFGSSIYSIGIYLGKGAFTLEAVDIDVWGGTARNIGIVNRGYSPHLDNLDIRIDGGEKAYGIYSDHSYARVSNTKIVARHGDVDTYGIASINSSSLLITDTVITASAHSNATHAIYEKDSNSRIRNVIAEAYFGQYCRGVYTYHSTTTISNCEITARNGSNQNVGILDTAYSAISLINVQASAPAGAACYGMLNSSASRATVENSVLAGKDHGVSINSASTRIINTRIDGGVVNNPTGKQCRGTYTRDLADVNCGESHPLPDLPGNQRREYCRAGG